jgi:hypothetical protein
MYITTIKVFNPLPSTFDVFESFCSYFPEPENMTKPPLGFNQDTGHWGITIEKNTHHNRKILV